jgi:multidrug efflux pump subunit AcrA (membrane-fusion protein)
VRRTPLLVALAVAVSVAGAACTPSRDGISLDSVRTATVVEVVDVPASVTARAVATLTAPADGTVASLSAQPGTTVAKGAVLAVIDSPSAQQRLADARAALTAASGGVGAVRLTDLTRLQDHLDASAADAFAAARSAAAEVGDAKVRAALLAQVDVAQKQYESTAQTTRALATQVQQGVASLSQAVGALGAAQRAQAKAAYDVAAATVDALTLRAPIAGVVQLTRPASASAADPLAGLLGAVSSGGAAGAAGAVGAAGAATGASAAGTGTTVAGVDDVLAVGDHVSAGTAVVTIVDVSEIGLVGEVDETDVLLVKPGVTAQVDLDAAPGVDYEATVGTVDLLPTPSSRGGVAYRIRLSFAPTKPGDTPPPTPRPGMSAVAHLRVRTATNAIAVPAAAVFSTGGHEAVWVIRDGHAVQQQVELGVQGVDLVQVSTGLQLGQRVVVAGTDRVVAGETLP